MEMNAGDIESQDFSLARKGYDRDEVDRFRAETAARVRGLEERLAEARAAAATEDTSSRLTKYIGEILMLTGEQAQRATDEAETEANDIIAAAHAEVAAATAQADAARRITREAIEAVRQRVAENIDVELALRYELEVAALALSSDPSVGPGSTAAAQDPLAQTVSDAVNRASTPTR